MKLRHLILLGITSFSVTALWNLPATVAYHYIPHNNLQISGLKGTVWRGEAEEITIQQVTLNTISWSIDLLKSLSSFALKSNVEIQDPDLTFKGLAGINISQTLSLEDAFIETKGTFISKFQKLAKLSGNIKSDIKHLEVAKETLPIVDATLHWKQGKLLSPLLIQPAGDYSITVIPTDKGLTAKISSANAPLALSGNAKINHEWNYTTNITIKAAAASGKGTMNIIKIATGKLEKDGSAIIKQEGKLKPFY